MKMSLCIISIFIFLPKDIDLFHSNLGIHIFFQLRIFFKNEDTVPKKCIGLQFRNVSSYGSFSEQI